MATADQLQQLKNMIGADAASQYTDDQLNAIIDANDTIEAAAAQVWESVAASYSNLVNISEAGSSRSLGSLYANALQMAKYYRGLDATNGVVPGEAPATHIRVISRG